MVRRRYKAALAGAALALATTQADNAASSATTAATQATLATTNGAAQVALATTQANLATTNGAVQVALATTQANNAASSASTAATQATASASSASTSATQATNSANSATASANSATSASSAQTAAESARDATLAAYDNFDDRYLGAKSSSPTVDNDGNALIAGSLFFDTVNEAMKIYTGSAWVAAYVTGADFLPTSGGGITGDLAFGDNNKAIFGAGNDLQIYHDASESIIEDVGTGDLKVRGSDEVKIQVRNAANTAWLNAVVAADAGAVTLSHNNSAKLATKATGIDVTGAITTDAITETSAGKVGIGTVNPPQKFVVSNAGADNIVMCENNSASIQMFMQATSGTGSVGTLTNHDVQFLANNSEKMRIDSSGNVGIGTTSPDYNLQIEDDTSSVNLSLRSGTASNSRIYFGDSGSAVIGQIVYRNGNDSMAFETNGSEAMRIDSSNNVGIGTVSPNAILDVEGANINFASSENGILNVFSNDATAVNKGGSISLGGNSESGSLGFAMIKGAKESTDAGYLAFGTRSAAANSTERLRILSNGNVGIGTASPDSLLELYKAGTSELMIGSDNAGTAQLSFYEGNSSTKEGFLKYDGANNNVVLGTSGAANALVIPRDSGNVGIGNASPNTTTKLDVNGAARFGNTTDGVVIENSSGAYGIGNASYIRRDQSTGHLELVAGSTAARNMLFKTKTNGAESVRITSFGDVGIGRSDPQNIVGNHGGGLVIRSAAGRAASTTLFCVQSIGSNSLLDLTEAGQFRLRNSSNTQTLIVDTSGNLTATGNVTAYSDERLKSDITTIDSALDKVTAMRGVTFTKDGEASSGVIAQELEKIAPELVMEGEEYKSVAYGNLVGYLIEAVKELSAKVEELENASSK